MNVTLNELVEKILELPIDEKLEIKNVIDHSLVEDQRNQIYQHFLESQEEEKSGKLRFSNDISELKKLIK